MLEGTLSSSTPHPSSLYIIVTQYNIISKWEEAFFPLENINGFVLEMRYEDGFIIWHMVSGHSEYTIEYNIIV